MARPTCCVMDGTQQACGKPASYEVKSGDPNAVAPWHPWCKDCLDEEGWGPRRPLGGSEWVIRRWRPGRGPAVHITRQTTDLVQWVDSNGVVLGRISADGGWMHNYTRVLAEEHLAMQMKRPESFVGRTWVQ